jgi:sugar/nucleoside kinase (ribokinase family)
VQEEALMLGGEAANTANALVKWGRGVVLAGNGLGLGPDADLLRELLEDKGLADSLLPIHHSRSEDAMDPTPVCDIYVTPDGERTMFGRGFAGMQPEFALSELPFKAGELFTAEPNMDAASRLAAQAAVDAGMLCYLMDFIRDNEPIAPGSFWQSSTDWAGYRNNTQKNVQWVKNWIARHGCFTILSDGPNGFVAGSPDMPARAYPPYPTPDVVDTTGAGDMFRAGMLFGLDQGWAPEKCLQFASAAGCLKCRALGATTEVPSVEEVSAYVAEHEQVSRQYL